MENDSSNQISQSNSNKSCTLKRKRMSMNKKELREEDSISLRSRSSSSESNPSESKDKMAHILYSSPESRCPRYTWIRKAVIFSLFMAANILILMDWRLKYLRQQGRRPVRGGHGLRPIGEVCHVDVHTGQKHLINNRHSIVFDAGSTGSRVHVYEFQYCGPLLRHLVDEVFEEVKPGLSHYHENPLTAAKSLKSLLEIASDRVPKKRVNCTPLIVKATAGLRLLPEASVTSILQNVRSYIKKHQFLIGNGKMTEEEAVNVMDGSEEGVFAWVTVNFLMEKLRPEFSISPFNPLESSVIMDLGGGSTQIVFATPNNMNFDPSKYPEYYYRLKLHGHQVDLYQQSYLGYGLMEARKNIKRGHVERMLADGIESRPLRFSCFPKDYNEAIDFEGRKIDLMGDSLNWDSCLSVVSPIFKKNVPCKLEPCSFNGIHQPTIKSKSLIGFSYFYDRLIPLGLTSPVTLFDIDREGRKLCQSKPTGRYLKHLEENPQWCLDLAYIYSLLRIGYSTDFDQPIVITKQINGYEAGWSLGAALKLMEDTPQCHE